MLVSFVYVLGCRVLEFVVLLIRGERSKELEIVVLRYQLSILRRQAGRPQLAQRDGLVLAALSCVLPRRYWHAFFVTPESCCAGTGGLSSAAGRTRIGNRVVRQSIESCGS